MTAVRIEELTQCFQGIVPSILTTCSADGEPNVTYLSQVFLVDSRHVALSRQFFNKTQANLAENPYAAVHLYDPITLDAYALQLRYLRSETNGALFDTMAARIQVIASHTGMAGVFELRSADVFEVLALEPVDGFLLPPAAVETPPPELAAPSGPLSELRGLQIVADRISRADNLDGLLNAALTALDELLGFRHSMLLLCEEDDRRLVAIHSRGYGDAGIGAEVELGCGTIGTAAERRTPIKVAGIGRHLRYGRTVRSRLAETGAPLTPEVPLPGLADAQAQLALPLLAGDRLVGVLAVESTDPLCFDEWDEAFLQIVASQIGVAIDRVQAADDDDHGAGADTTPAPGRTGARRLRTFVLYRNDDCVFVDGEYLVRNVPGLILWKLLCQNRDEGRVEFTNRELRLDPGLRLPPIKDNLESRLILLRKRLAEKCPDVALAPTARGRFALRLDCEVELIEKDSA